MVVKGVALSLIAGRPANSLIVCTVVLCAEATMGDGMGCQWVCRGGGHE